MITRERIERELVDIRPQLERVIESYRFRNSDAFTREALKNEVDNTLCHLLHERIYERVKVQVITNDDLDVQVKLIY